MRQHSKKFLKSIDLHDSIGQARPPRALQVERIAARDGLSESEIKSVLETQASREQRLAIADDIIVNDTSQEHLRSEIERLHRLYSETGHNLTA